MHQQPITLVYDGNQYTVICHIVHSPMRWNFWHFSFRWEIVGLGYLHELEEGLRRKFADKVGKIGRGQVKMHAQWNELQTLTVDKNCYLKPIRERIKIWFKKSFSISSRPN